LRKNTYRRGDNYRSFLLKYITIATIEKELFKFEGNCFLQVYDPRNNVSSFERLPSLVKPTLMQTNQVSTLKLKQTLVKLIKLTPSVGHCKASQSKTSSKIYLFKAPPNHQHQIIGVGNI
jgi:hypothetical protein